ncbi:MAG: hypothetical protein HY286_11195 [Planctomycetes bacterium]|nr:hypothetical protein [Planctomycetota bacterium]
MFRPLIHRRLEPLPAGRLLIGSLLLLSAVPACTDSTVRESLQKLTAACPISNARPGIRGLRTVSVATDKGSKVTHEQVFDDGGFDIGLKTIASRDSNAGDSAVLSNPGADLIATLHGRMTYKYRDLAIDQLSVLDRNYNVSVVQDGDIIAGHPTIQFTFIPRQSFSYAYKTVVNADSTSGVPLQVKKLDLADQVIYQMTYDSIEIGNLQRTPSDPRTLPDPPQKVNLPTEAPTPLATTGLTGGFEFVEQSATSIDMGDHVAYYVVDRFTDGLQHLFVTQGNPKDTFIGDSPFLDATDAAPIFAYTNLGAVTVVWGQRHGRALASFGPFDQTALAGVLSSYEPKH